MSEKKIVKIQDVAKYAGVGVATVSRVLNGTKQVSEEKRQRVLDAVNALNYEVNKLAQSLKSGKTNVICVIVPAIQNLFFPILLHNIHVAAQKYGYSVSIHETERNIDLEKKYVQMLKMQMVDGILLTSSADVDDPDTQEYINSLTDLNYNGKRIPVTLVEANINNNLDCVVLNDKKAIFDATSYLLSLGKTNIAFIGGPYQFEPAKNRKIGYKYALELANIPILDDYIIDGDFSAFGGYHCMKELLSRNIKIDALVTANDQMAIGAIRCISEHNLKIPQDIAVIGMDNNFVTSLISPSLTTMNIPKETMGEYAFKLLHNRITNPKLKRQQIILETDLVKRETTEQIVEHKDLHNIWELPNF